MSSTVATPARWDHRSYGTRADPVRQSDLFDLAGSYGCAQRFAFRKRAAVDPSARVTERVSWKPALGNARHETIRRYLTDPAQRVLRGTMPSLDALEECVRAELQRAADGLPVEWYDDDPAKELRDAAVMIGGLLADLPSRVAEIVFCEAPFLAEIDSGTKGASYWLVGTVDFVYRDHAGALVLADFKSGAQRLHQIILDHGYQFGIYAHALERGVFLPGTEHERQVAAFPDALFVVHLRDYLPYQKKTSKTVERPEEVEFFGTARGRKVTLEAGQRRGPAWYRARRSPEDVARLRHSIRNIVSTVRLGRFVEAIDEHCVRCDFRDRCLSAGHVDDTLARDLEKSLRGLDLTGTGADEIAA